SVRRSSGCWRSPVSPERCSRPASAPPRRTWRRTTLTPSVPRWRGGSSWCARRTCSCSQTGAYPSATALSMRCTARSSIWRQAPGHRATLRQRLGAHLEGRFAPQLQDVASELAYHFEAGAVWARAVTYLRVVAETAAQRYAYREAATTLQHALALIHHLPE